MKTTFSKGFAYWWQLVISVACLLYATSSLAEGCDDLEGDALTACLTVLVCIELDDVKARNQCLEVVRQLLENPDLPAQVTELPTTSEPEEPILEVESVSDDPVPSEHIEEVEIAIDPSSDAEPVTEKAAATPAIEERQTEEPPRKRRWLSWMRIGRDRSAEVEEPETPVGLTVDGVPKEFAATVVAVAKAGYNDALVVLNNRYVFVVTRAYQSRIKKGDVIVAQKKEGLSGRHSFLFYGKGASVDAQRVDCTHIEPSRQTRRRCEFATKQLGMNAR